MSSDSDSYNRKDVDVTVFSLYIISGRVYKSDYQLKADIKRLRA